MPPTAALSRFYQPSTAHLLGIVRPSCTLHLSGTVRMIGAAWLWQYA